MLMVNEFSRVFAIPVILLLTLANACAALELPDQGDNPPVMLEWGKYTLPVGVSVKGPSPDNAAPGTWVFMGYSPKGSLKAIVQRGAATALPEEPFAADLEIMPRTHPVDIRPSSDSMDSKARFRFYLFTHGEKCLEPVRYSASLVGHAGEAPRVSNKKTMMGAGSVVIDQPGTWWITAEKKNAEGETVLASLTFKVEGKPGPDHYAAFTKDGTYLPDLEAVIAACGDAEVIFLGEQHTDPVAHYLEAEIFAAVHRARGKVGLTLEMFETDVQPVLDAYLAGLYEERYFLSDARPWPRYKSDYRPMIEYARKHQLPVVAGNAPRRLVNLVTRRGQEALKGLPEAELRWIPSPDYFVPVEGRYVDKLTQVFSDIGASMQKSGKDGPRSKRDWLAKGAPAPAEYNDLLLKAAKAKAPTHGGGMPAMASMSMHGKQKKGYPSQSLWDATMAHSIAQFLESHPDHAVVQVNGAFHSDEHLGTVEQLLRYRPGTRIKVISLVPDEGFPAFDADQLAGEGDIIIVTDPTWMPEEDI